MSEANPDLESFREQWRAEVRSRHPVSAQQQQPASSGPSTSVTSSSGVASAPRKPPPPPTKKAVTAQDGDDDYVQPRSFDDAVVAQTVASAERVQTGGSSEPVSALDHYEKAVEREAAGKLGDSLSLYRKAFRMDDNVDQKYKNKHFPRPPPKPATQIFSTHLFHFHFEPPSGAQCESCGDRPLAWETSDAATVLSNEDNT
jgi:F-box protein 9